MIILDEMRRIEPDRTAYNFFCFAAEADRSPPFLSG